MSERDDQVAAHLRVLMAIYRVRAAEISRRSGIAEADLSRILAGQQRPRPETVERIEAAIRGEVRAGV